MRRIFSALTFALLALSIAAAQGMADRKQYELLGPVKTIEVGRIDYTPNGGKNVAGKRIPRQKITFNEDGNKTEEISYDESGAISSKSVYTYDKQGRPTDYLTYSSGADKTLSKSQKNVYKLDDKGNVIEYTVYQFDGTVGTRFLYKYDAQGNRIDETTYAWNGARVGKLLSTYDEAGHLLTLASYNADDSISWKIVNTYNAKGNKIEATQYIVGILRYRVTFNYDDKGRIIEEETLEYNKPPNSLRSSHSPEAGRIVYTYNDKERTKEIETYKEDGSLKNRMIYQLDERGNEVGLRIFNPDGSLKSTDVYWYDNGKLLRSLSGLGSTKFEYDSKGNWIKKVYRIQPAEAIEPEAYNAEYRDITYY
jgi:hypothetical protein